MLGYAFEGAFVIQMLSEPKLHSLLEEHYDYKRPDIRCFCMDCLSAKFWWKNQYKMNFPARPDWAFKSEKFKATFTFSPVNT
jgi:hypothetical protein